MPCSRASSFVADRGTPGRPAPWRRSPAVRLASRRRFRGHPELARLPAGATLIGLGGGDVEGVMGRPALVRQEGGAQYWRYSLAGCQLDLFLYADPTAGSVRVAYLDARAGTSERRPRERAACADLAARLRAGVTPSRAQPVPTVSDPL